MITFLVICDRTVASPGTTVSSNNKIDRDDINEILLKVVLNTISQPSTLKTNSKCIIYTNKYALCFVHFRHYYTTDVNASLIIYNKVTTKGSVRMISSCLRPIRKSLLFHVHIIKVNNTELFCEVCTRQFHCVLARTLYNKV